MKIRDLEKLLHEIDIYCDVESSECVAPLINILSLDVIENSLSAKDGINEEEEVWQIRNEIYEIMREHFREIDVK